MAAFDENEAVVVIDKKDNMFDEPATVLLATEIGALVCFDNGLKAWYENEQLQTLFDNLIEEGNQYVKDNRPGL